MILHSGGIIETSYGTVYWDRHFDDGGYVEIYGLYVKPECRGKGCARAILESAIRLIKLQYPDKEIRILADPKEQGIQVERLAKFYTSLGLILEEKEKL